MIGKAGEDENCRRAPAGNSDFQIDVLANVLVAVILFAAAAAAPLDTDRLTVLAPILLPAFNAQRCLCRTDRIHRRYRRCVQRLWRQADAVGNHACSIDRRRPVDSHFALLLMAIIDLVAGFCSAHHARCPSRGNVPAPVNAAGSRPFMPALNKQCRTRPHRTAVAAGGLRRPGAVTPLKSASRALEQFLASVERRAYRQAVLALRHHDDALDIVQESMLRLVKHYADAPEADWPKLFQRILHSQMMDYFRRRKVRQKLFVWFSSAGEEDGEDLIETLPDRPQNDPAVLHALRTDTETVLSALSCLPMRQKQAFLLRHYEGLSERDTAFAMGCSEGSVKTHLSRAVHALRARLEQADD